MGKAARQCKSGQHTIPAGARRCLPCKRAAERAEDALHPGQRRGALAEKLRALRMPLLDILDAAACSLEIAYLFDPNETQGKPHASDARHAAAIEVCDECPVREACRQDAYDNRALGVYGGHVFDHAFWTAEGRRLRHRGVVQDVQSVQDSPV